MFFVSKHECVMCPQFASFNGPYTEGNFSYHYAVHGHNPTFIGSTFFGVHCKNSLTKTRAKWKSPIISWLKQTLIPFTFEWALLPVSLITVKVHEKKSTESKSCLPCSENIVRFSSHYCTSYWWYNCICLDWNPYTFLSFRRSLIENRVSQFCRIFATPIPHET